MPFFIIFLMIPLMEIAVFVIVGQYIGLGWTLGLALLTAMCGGLIIRHQGFMTVNSMRGSLESHELPLKAVFDGFCLVAAGALLITPGFITDIIGFSLLMPPVRAVLRNHLKNSKMFQMSGMKTGHYGNSSFQYQSHDPNVIDGEYEKVRDDDQER